MLQNNRKGQILRIVLKRNKPAHTQILAHMCDKNTLKSLIIEAEKDFQLRAILIYNGVLDQMNYFSSEILLKLFKVNNGKGVP